MENWFIFSLLTGIFFGLQTIFIKSLSSKYGQYTILSFLFGIAALLLLPGALKSYQITDPQNFVTATAISFSINIIAFSLLVYVLRIAAISRVAPFFNLTPLFITLSGWIVLGETLTTNQYTGVIIIVTGCLFLQGKNLLKIKAQGRAQKKELKAVLLALFVAAIWSISATYEKVAINASNPLTYAFYIHGLLGGVFMIIAFFKRDKKTEVFNTKNIALLIMLGAFTAVMAFSQYHAIMLTTVAPVIALKRAGIILSALAGFLWFKEGNIAFTTAGVILILYGAWILT